MKVKLNDKQLDYLSTIADEERIPVETIEQAYLSMLEGNFYQDIADLANFLQFMLLETILKS